MGNVNEFIDIDPDICSGKPRIDRTGISTEIVFTRYIAGESILTLTNDYDVRDGAIRAAINHEYARLKKLEEKRGSAPINPDSEFLNWLADRLVNQYGESENTDFVLKLRGLANIEVTPSLINPDSYFVCIFCKEKFRVGDGHSCSEENKENKI